MFTWRGHVTLTRAFKGNLDFKRKKMVTLIAKPIMIDTWQCIVYLGCDMTLIFGLTGGML